MPQIDVHDLSIRYRGPVLLDGVSCQIEAGQRIGLLGRNGSGKTTLLKILAGEVEPDAGTVNLAAGTRISLLPQHVPGDTQGGVAEIVARGLPAEMHAAPDESWKREQKVDQTLAQSGLDARARFESLSSGMKRRVLLARCLVASPDVLLLDEPTNHLDISTIVWLEELLLRWKGTLVFVTHDRMFLRHLATRIIEIERGRLFDWSCDYDTFLRRREEMLAAEEKQEALFDKKLADEERWIRQGIKARRTRNEGRVRALEAMRRQRQRRRVDPGRVNLQIDAGRRSGNLVAEAREVSFGFGDCPVVSDFSVTIMRGDKVGIMGPNGAGKTTLLRILLGQLRPDRGSVRLGTNLQIAYFDQLRAQLDEEASVQDNVGDGYDTVTVAGNRRHVIGYLQEFLFTPERARTPVKFASGGERNRILLARLFAKPANLIVLDEPTNDLDAETLELLEERLVEFRGTVILVSHDRAFLNNIVTNTLVFEDDAVREYDGGYDDWLRARQARQRTLEKKQSNGQPIAAGKTRHAAEQQKRKASPAKRRLSYKEKQELADLPDRIEGCEAQIAELHHFMTQPEYYRQEGDLIARQQARLKELESELAAAYARWEKLEDLANGC